VSMNTSMNYTVTAHGAEYGIVSDKAVVMRGRPSSGATRRVRACERGELNCHSTWRGFLVSFDTSKWYNLI